MNYNMNNNINNNMNNNNNNTAINNQNSNNNNNNGPPVENIPRKDITIHATGGSSSESDLINVTLQASSGIRVVMKVSRNITMKELFRLYIEKLGIGENLLERKEIIFN